MVEHAHILWRLGNVYVKQKLVSSGKLKGTHKTRNKNSTMKMKTLRVVITKPEETD